MQHMFITKEEIKSELVGEECWDNLSAKEQKMFLLYTTNGQEEVEAFKEVYMTAESARVVKFPGPAAAKILAKEDFQECFSIYAEILREAVSTKANAWMFNQYFLWSSYSILDFVDEIGAFKFKTIDEAREKLGSKASAITGFQVSVHPKDPTKTMTVPVLADKYKAMKELARFTKYYGSEEAGGVGLGAVSISSKLAVVTTDDDEVNRRKIGLGEA